MAEAPEGTEVSTRKRKPPVPRNMLLDPHGTELLRVVLKVGRDATSFLPERCQGFLYGRPRNLRYELKAALDSFEDHLDRTGEL